MNQKTSGIILTAAKADITICEVFGELPTGLIPVNGKPIIFFILQQLYDNGIVDVYIGVDYKKDKLIEIVDLYFSTKLNIKYIFTDKNRAPGNSLLTILKEIDNGKVVVNLGDTYIKNFNFSKFDDALVVSNDFLDEKRWATVRVKDDFILEFKDKERSGVDDLYAICGLYTISDLKLIKDFESELDKNIQITDLMSAYLKSKSLKVIKTNEWLDFGHIDKYYISKKRLIQSRGFNSLEYDDLLGTITKRSQNKDKFINEIKWQLDLPKSLKVLSPRVLDYSLDSNEPFITMEFYSYPTLSEIWLFSELNEKVYISVIDKLLTILRLFKANKKVVSFDDYMKIYYEKTVRRVQNIENREILDLMKHQNININGVELKNWSILQSKLSEKIKELYNENDNCFIHGDFCLSNILYDLRSGIVRLIDPRGIWGSGENGDIKYDVAKLRHSICGDYDYIVNDLFKIDTLDSSRICYSIFYSNKQNVKTYFDKRLSDIFNIEHIKLIEGLLFLSMVALHKDSASRQVVMYAKAIKLLNEVL
ncbi:hypothetical protein CRV08_06045 [Halarcobacter ebronensis]|uniref:Nucleotidyl transferase domain-containing protein n=1 Tax=Halarcobacter ebronensis TaxID=1462615 RepID=A0A4Q0YES2_9BACT|nr:hypothetical protein [Halarcobacter ebronensis]RXJ68990.1 hypothetical protein CRV08_06045 [Halarcobacter ebronensis]